MGFLEELEAVEKIQEWVREDGFMYTSEAMKGMVEDFVYEGDIKRAMEQGRYLGTQRRGGRPVFLFSGPGLNGDPLALACRLNKSRVMFVAVARIPAPPSRDPGLN